MGVLNRTKEPPSTDKWVLFDFDGTIAETTSVLISFWNEFIAEKHKIRTLTNEELDELRNLTTSEKLAFMKIPFYKLPFVVGSARKFFPQIMHELPVAEGLREALVELKEMKYKLGILSSNKKSNIEKYLVEHDLDELFSYISCDKGRSLFVKHKTLNHFVKEMNVPKDQVVYVGDETRDIFACRKAELVPISVTWGWDSREVLHSVNADHWVDAPADLPKAVQVVLG